MRDWSPSLVHLSVGLMVAGFAVIALGWNGSASRDFVEGQLPYVISGGLAGLGLLASGLVLALVREVRRGAARIEAKLEWLAEQGGVHADRGPTVVPEDEMVVAGRTSYHDPDCHLVRGSTTTQPMDAETASARGLAPCRVCTPDADEDAAAG